ncbi:MULTISPECIES: NAD+ synthase [Variovorax]|uniref:Glutamine-dependent NAD(+) synthetase n=1 Tax=Variovorax boronicumulans TaxID=436515 RepID=A0AAW8DQH8_9BURK|nr:NAD+ synthase [Variovorax boronicumulans]MDP9876257.1 NAD+ synthase (glutamine-hydrolyzing) [Variovorax boronicumulans]MDP9921541.1 NAD+ synthase (glutamine-hydrolyzing) [Variovorax boronicumulans]
MTLKLAIAQLNFVVGDLVGNAQKIVGAAREAYAQGARLLLTPELSIAGYAAEDLFLRPAFTEACDDAVKGIAAALADLKDMVVVVGHPSGGSLRSRSVAVQLRHNAASVLKEGRILETYAKRELPNYQVFDERRYFTPGQGTCVFEAGGVSVGLLICEDAWFDAPAELARAGGAEVLAVINASPYHVGKEGERVARMADRARAVGLPLVYAHLVGGQDEVVFDGASFALQADGALAAQAESFRERLVFMELARGAQGGVAVVADPSAIAAPRDAEAQLWDALVLGVRDYVGKNGFPGAILGLSGGIDSALVLAIAVDALGKDKVRAVMMPSPYTADISWIDARDMAGRLGVRYDEISIKHTFESFKAALAGEFAGRPEDTAEENIQARIRGTLLMGLSNKFGAIVLTTGNKSEMATGYCTLYGDMAGGFAVIKDLLKTTVFALARWRNAHDPYGTGAAPIPERIITRPPSAELRPDQTDQDSLPPYDVLDGILARYMQDDEGIDEIIAAGYDRAVVERVARLIRINEYKRRQAPVGIRVTHRSFGKDWRYPITSKFNETAGAQKP